MPRPRLVWMMSAPAMSFRKYLLAFWRAQVQRDATLPALAANPNVVQSRDRGARGLGQGKLELASGTTPMRFDDEHVGPQVREDHGPPTAREGVPEIQDADALQRMDETAGRWRLKLPGSPGMSAWVVVAGRVASTSCGMLWPTAGGGP